MWTPTSAAGRRPPLSMKTSKAVIQIGELPKPFVEGFTARTPGSVDFLLRVFRYRVELSSKSSDVSYAPIATKFCSQ
jgi:hypothetical protein